MGEKMAFRARNPEQTRADILAAARAEFAKLGLAGARVDTIADASGANKRMIYHYFGGKEQLFEAVIEEAYVGIRAGESELGLDEMTPTDALHALVVATWQYYLDNPEFITLVNSANLHQARHIAGNKQLRKLQKAYVERVAGILQRGEAQRKFRKGIDPVQLCITIAAIGFYYLTNRHTGGVLFGFNFMSRDALAKRLQFNLDTVMRLVLV
ncbi:TetR/AcrR family transcriptional regulator [Paucibacter sp. R3-3]|uniref:TetR/AcrR family transcriptional regulator n=2 Tax=Roseateles agri TaxID=3098619 RepID=A0ABU5DCA0_9BURK|nr:TetR/AcrR family transcriptional regulator [Paucibacter sp. R3-3]